MKKWKVARLAAIAGAMASAGAALAEVPAAVNTELTGAKVDVNTIGALVFGIVVAIALWKWFKRAM